ncbi:hypothetical protein HII12_003457 [Brettanomyces bruxellensis]|uniref:Uncharacterized protein n=1 Tax=Dekkera bruxellensis TaxID=5007 RepID=A0A8H6BE23_DEKBR|nr:hypothetical protein HII12_003457 [Brettanomyces bruxellensis]
MSSHSQMLQSKNISKVLVQLLQPNPEVSTSLPISISLVSLSTSQPLISCISDLYKKKMVSRTNAKKIQQDEELRSIISNEQTNEDVSVLDSEISAFRSTGGDEYTNSKGQPGANRNANGESKKTEPLSKIEQIQKQIDYLETHFDGNYINANVDPSDNLSIISILCFKEFKSRKHSNMAGVADPWMIISFSDYLAFIYEINDQYALLLCCDSGYPKGFSIKRLENASKFLKSQL